MNQYILAAVLLASLAGATNPEWPSLRGSFLPLTNNSYAPFPTTINDANINDQNWERISTDCSNDGLFNGFQYIRTVDDGVALLYDVQGTIAGIQMLINQTAVRTETNNLKYNNLPVYQNITYNGELYYVLTAYLVEPTTICTTGRNATALNQQGVGDGLRIQNGDNPGDLLEVPMSRPDSTDEEENDGWTKNNCFLGMGNHNFRRISQYFETNCTEMYPVFGLYNKDSNRLHGFGFITVGKLTSKRLEHPPKAAIKAILGDGRTPQCVLDLEEREGVSSLHVYFTERPGLIGCSLKSSWDAVRGLFSG